MQFMGFGGEEDLCITIDNTLLYPGLTEYSYGWM